MIPSWHVGKLWLTGKHRHAVLLHHAQESGKMAGYYMDSYLEWRNGMPVVNISMVKSALKEMDKLDRVTRLMYQAGYLSLQGMGEFMATNNKNRNELRENVNPELMKMFG